MKHIKFNKTVCGVDFLLNVIDTDTGDADLMSEELYTTDFFQIVFVNQGKGTLLLNDQTIEIKANDVLFISQHQKHKWHFEPDSFNATFLVFQEDFLNDFFSDQYFTYRLMYFYQIDSPLFLNLPSDAKDQYISQLKEIKQELVHVQTDSVHLIRSILYYVLTKLNRTYSEEYKISATDTNNSIALQFRKLVEQNINTKQRVEDYAEMLKVSRISLNKAVKKQFNQTTAEFLKARLVYKIKMELIYSNKSIDELAMEFNFSESNHFSRFFKAQTGLTPSNYREDYQNGSS
ncbi:AraC family transcriptional regulator [Puteibacter caeruleilacunae]|nr:AraC family transcriptional regulator [Puteibacter caeruleilacunae]